MNAKARVFPAQDHPDAFDQQLFNNALFRIAISISHKQIHNITIPVYIIRVLIVLIFIDIDIFFDTTISLLKFKQEAMQLGRSILHR